MKYLFIFFAMTGLLSCKTILLKSKLKDPVVETKSTIEQFLIGNDFPIENSFVLKGDTATAFDNLMLGYGSGFFLFDKDGNQLCYKGTARCHGTQFYQLLENQNDSFGVCQRTSQNISNILARTEDLNGNSVSFTGLPKSRFYLVCYWQKFMMGKMGYEDGINWMEKEIEKKNLREMYTVIKINTDLQDSWGLVAGQKAKLNFKKQNGKFDITITDLPINNKP